MCEECGHRASSRNGLQMHIKAKHRLGLACFPPGPVPAAGSRPASWLLGRQFAAIGNRVPSTLSVTPAAFLG